MGEVVEVVGEHGSLLGENGGDLLVLKGALHNDL